MINSMVGVERGGFCLFLDGRSALVVVRGEWLSAETGLEQTSRESGCMLCDLQPSWTSIVCWFPQGWTPCFLPSNHPQVFIHHTSFSGSKMQQQGVPLLAHATKQSGKHWKGFFFCSFCSLEPSKSLLIRSGSRGFPDGPGTHSDRFLSATNKKQVEQNCYSHPGTTSNILGNRYSVFIAYLQLKQK